MAWQSTAQRRGRFECLEQRQLLAGDVVLEVVDGQLMIQGDLEDNKIMITSGAEAGAFVVTGLDTTTVHEDGQPPGTDPVTVTGVHGIQVDLGEGDDLVAVVGANVRGSLSIGTGAGDDRVLIGTGGDAAELVGVLPGDLAVNIRGSLRVDTDANNDHVSIDDATIGGPIGVAVGEGDDEVSLGGTSMDESARVRVGGGVRIGLGAGDDELSLDHVNSRGAVFVHGDSGDDMVHASHTNAFAMLVWDDAGNDTVMLADVHARHLGIHTGVGDDNVDVRDSVFSLFGVSLGAGDDTLTTAALQARVGVMLGGEGEDTFDLVSENDIGFEVIRGFEVPPDVNTSELPFGQRRLGRLLHWLR